MTIEQFDKTAFTKGMRAKTEDGYIYYIVSLDLEERLIGVKTVADISWLRCENIELIN